MSTKREAVKKEDQWNTEALYPSFEAWDDHYKQIKEKNTSPYWPKIAAYKGRLSEGPLVVKEALDEILRVDRELSKLCSYAHLKHDEEITIDKFKQANNQATALFHQFAIESSWFDPELLALPQLDSYLNAPELKEYRFHLDKLVRIKKHTLSPEKKS